MISSSIEPVVKDFCVNTLDSGFCCRRNLKVRSSFNGSIVIIRKSTIGSKMADMAQGTRPMEVKTTMILSA